MCNEAFQDWDFRDACRAIRKAGYTGIEIAPFTLAEDPATISTDRRVECRRIIQEEGLTFVGLHWLMVSPKGLHVTTADPQVRSRSWKHIHDLIDLCADLGSGGVLVFGSPQQRGTTDGVTRQQATEYFKGGFAEAAPHAQSRGVTLLVEALPSSQCNVVQTLEEAISIVRDVASPAVQTMFDTHNAADETDNHAELIDRYFDHIRHVHVNEMDGRHPGQGDYDFKPVLSILKKRNYTGWISLEVFDFSPGPERIAQESLRYLERVQDSLPE
jgi:sugar phosphate isomerase/epimerase